MGSFTGDKRSITEVMINHFDILKVFWSISFVHKLREFLDVTEEYSSIVSVEGR